MQISFTRFVDTIVERKGSVIFTGANGVGKTLLAVQAAENALRKGRKVVYALTTMAPESFLELANSISVNLGKYLQNNSLVIVDCHTREESSSLAKYTVSPESSLLEIRQKLLEAAEYANNFFLVIDDLSSLLAYVPSENAFKFYQAVASDVRKSFSTSIAIIVPDILEQKLTNLLYSISDGVVEMTLEEMGGNLRRFLRIRFLRGVKHPTEWIEFTIGMTGIELLV